MHIETTLWIQQPREVVFDFMTTAANWPTYMPQVVAAKQVSDGPVGLDSRIDFTISFMASTVDMGVVLNRFERPDVLGSRNSQESGMDTRTLTTFAEVRGGTQLHRVTDMVSRSMFRFLSRPLIEHIVGRNDRREFANLKDILENGAIT
jgi:hypothetical protein